MPASAILRVLEALPNRAIFGKTPLETASKAGALCVVIRSSDWKPRHGDKVSGVKFSRSVLRPYVRSTLYIQEHKKDPQLVTSEQETFGAEAFIAGSGNAQNTANNKQMISADLTGHATNVEEQRLNIVGLKMGVENGTAQFGLPFMPTRRLTAVQNKKVYGVCHLPPGYCLSILPRGTAVVGIHLPSEGLNQRTQRRWWAGYRETVVNPDLDDVNEISSSHSSSTGVIAILQTLYAAFTLYETKGDQIKRYGYAAFGLTVAPYLVMSLMNLINSVLTPNYAAVYIIKSEIMAEAERREGARFEGFVGSLPNAIVDPNESEVVFEVEADDRTIMYESTGRHNRSEEMQTENTGAINAVEVKVNSSGPLPDDSQHIRIPSGALAMGKKRKLLPLLGASLVGSVSVAIIAIISHFETGKSTPSQRAWMMTWLALGICIGPSFGTGHGTNSPYVDAEEFRKLWLVFAIMVPLCCVPAVGGFVVVAQMLQEYGNCIHIY